MHRNILTHVPEGWEVQDGGATSDNSLSIASSQGKKAKKREDTRKKCIPTRTALIHSWV